VEATLRFVEEDLDDVAANNSAAMGGAFE